MPQGIYDPAKSYEKLDVVTYNGNAYSAKKATKGVAPTDANTWKMIIDNSAATQALINANNAVTLANQTSNSVPTKIQEEIAKLTDANASMTEVISARTTSEEVTYPTLKERLDAEHRGLREDIRRIDYKTQTHKYGILWDRTNATCTRLYDAVGMTAAAHKGSINANLVNDFDNVYPWSHRKLCNVDIAEYKRLYEAGADIENAITAWEDDPDFSYTGSNGAVMVYTPGFWMHTEETDGGVIVAIADGEIEGWIKVPRYIGGRYHASDDGKGGITSVAGTMPLTFTAMSTLHNKAKVNKMTIDDIWTWTYDTVLLAVEFATLNTQSAVGDGASNVYRYDGNNLDHPLIAETGANRVIAPLTIANAAIPGAILDIGTSGNNAQVGRRLVTSIETYPDNTNYKIVNFSGAALNILTTHCLSIHGIYNTTDAEIGSKSGYVGANGKANAYYRGRIAHANDWRYVLGAYRQKDTGHIWIAHNREEADNYDALNTSVHIDTGFKLPYQADGTTRKEGYVKELYFHKDFPLFPFVKDVGGNSANPVGDYCWHPDISTANTILICGGDADYGAYAGRLYGYWGNTAGSSAWSFAALPFLK